MTSVRSATRIVLRCAAAVALPVLVLGACGADAGGSSASASSASADAGSGGGSARAALDTARATFASTAGQQIGTATLIGTPQGVLVQADLNGIEPGTHAFHLHESGSCSPDFTASGGHFNPHGSGHGFLDDDGRHAGDLPNIHVPESGELEVEYLADLASLREGEAALLDDDGAAIVIHQNPDDYRTDPAGAGGSRISCAVIRD